MQSWIPETWRCLTCTTQDISKQLSSIKALLGKALMDSKEECKEMLQHMDEIHEQVKKMDAKINLITKATNGFEFAAKDGPPTKIQEVPTISIFYDDQVV